MVARLLLDTSFLLPAFEIDAGREVEGALALLAEHAGRVRVSYSPYSLLEVLFVLLREVRRGALKLEEAVEMAEAGVERVIFGLEEAPTPPEAFARAISLYGMGHTDVFDNLLYATAVANKMLLLTLDCELVEFLESRGLPRAAVLPHELERLLRG